MFRNRDGTPVDPVPFLVVAALSFLVTFSVGPIYAVAVGFSFPVAVSLSAGVFVATTAGAYVRFVWQARPAIRAEVPPHQRLSRLVYAALCLALLLVLLVLPLL
jgi:cytochrome b561